MKLVYRVTEDDFMEARRLAVANEKWIRRTFRRINPWLGGFVMVLGIGVFVLTREVVNLFICVFGGFMLYATGLAPTWNSRKRYRNDRRFHTDITTEISVNGLHVVMSGTASDVQWNAIIRSLESDKIFMLFFAEGIFMIIPKRAFAPSDVAAFSDMLHRTGSVPVGL